MSSKPTLTVEELSALQPRNSIGALYCLIATFLSVSGVALSLFDNRVAWICGQLVLAIALLQWFLLLHEAGHQTLFRSKNMNTIAGHLAALLSGFPCTSWTLIHFRHHKWTGWQDLDATTESLVPRRLKAWERGVINFCWKSWVPLFSLIYRINNYWNYPRICQYIRKREQRVKVVRDIVILVIVYVLLILAMGPSTFIQVFGLAFLLSLILQEVILLSQHTHVPTNVSKGKPVKPFPPLEQEVYTRSLRFPAWISSVILMHFDAHELHHMYVRVPGYNLRKIPYTTRNEVNWWEWIKGSKRLSGVSFLFCNREQTGFKL